MATSKRIHCAFCNKKCSGNVLRYQNQYYHKQCFEQEQAAAAAASANAAHQQQQQLMEEEYRRGEGMNLGEDTAEPVYRLGVASDHQSSMQSQQRRQASGSQQQPRQQQPPPPANSSEPLRAGHSQHEQQTIITTRTHSSSSTNETTTNHSLSRQPRAPARPQDIAAHSSASPRSQVTTSPSSAAGQPQNLSHQQGRRLAPMAADQRAHQHQQQQQQRSQTIDNRRRDNFATNEPTGANINGARSATLPHSTSAPANGFLGASSRSLTSCAGCKEKIRDGQALIALDLHWHVWCFKCTHCKSPLHGEYVAKDGRAYCERDYQKLFGVVCVYCKRYITGKVLQAGEAHHFHPSCARCSKCGDPFVPGEEMYLQGEVTWHPRCGPGPDNGSQLDELAMADSSSRSQLRASRTHSPSLSSLPRSRSASPFSYLSRQYGRASPNYADSEAVGDLSRIYTISYLNADPNQGYLRRPIEPNAPKSPQFSRPTSRSRAGDQQSRCSSSRSQYFSRERSVPRGMYSVLSSMRSGSSSRARSPSMMNEEAIQLAQYPSGQKPSPDAVPKIERDDFPAPPFPYPDRNRSGASSAIAASSSGKVSTTEAETLAGQQGRAEQRQHQRHEQQRASRPRSREIASANTIAIDDLSDDDDDLEDPQLRKEEEELSKIANGIGKIFLQTLKEREKLRAWKRANLDPRNASRTPSATRELPSKPLRYDNPTNASPSRDLDRPRPWEEEEGVLVGGGGGGGGAPGDHSPTRTRSSLGRSHMSSSTYGYKVIQSSRSTPRPGYGLTGGPYDISGRSEMSFAEQQRIAQARSTDLLNATRPLQTPTATITTTTTTTPTAASNNNTSIRGAGANGNSHLLQSSDLLNATTTATKSRPLSSVASSSHLRRSMPNVNLNNISGHLHKEGPPKLYPYHLLATSNYRLPPDVDRCHLERHLSNEEFQYIFHCDRIDFYRLPEWKRNELKRRARLF